jgi:hypothetical protein
VPGGISSKGDAGLAVDAQHRFLPEGSSVGLGGVTLDGLKLNIEVQARDGILKEPLPPPEKYVDLGYLKQAQKELGFYQFLH